MLAQINKAPSPIRHPFAEGCARFALPKGRTLYSTMHMQKRMPTAQPVDSVSCGRFCWLKELQ